MKTGFKNKMEEKDNRKIASPWNFDAPPYDERSSCYVNAGSHYGVGHTQPIGSLKHSNKGGVPIGRHHTMQDDTIRAKNETLDLKE